MRSGLYSLDLITCCAGLCTGTWWANRFVFGSDIPDGKADELFVFSLLFVCIEELMLVVSSANSAFMGWNWETVALFLMLFSGMEGLCEIDNQVVKLLRDGYGWNEEFWVTIYALRRVVCRIVATCDIVVDDAADGKGWSCNAGVDVFEDFIDFSVAMSTGFPAVDDTGVISIHNNVVRKVESTCNGHNEEFKFDGLCPGDVLLASICLPFGEEAPCPPFVANDNSNANARASI